MHHAFKINEREINVELSRSTQGYRLHVDGQVLSFDLKAGADGHHWLSLGGEVHEVVVATHGDDVFVHLDGEAYQLRYEHPLQRLALQAGGAAADIIRAPMPGSLVSVVVKAGEAVTKGQTLLVMESMKMETTIISPRDGIVAEVHQAMGQTFDRDALLVSLEPETAQ